jgi:hypothetical protein
MFGDYSKEDGKKLLKLARQSIEQEFGAGKPELLEEKQFKQLRGVFVTLNLQGRLKGCIGFPYPNYSIQEAVVRAAKSAAFSDSRFNSLKKEEFDKVKIEISILTNPVEASAKEIKVGRDGLIANYLGYSGLLLPQVAVEYKMNKMQFIEAVCDKAGLPRDAWQKSGFKLYKFQAQIFKED